MFLTKFVLWAIFTIGSPTVVSRPLPHGKLRDTTVNYIVLHYDSGTTNSTYKYLRRKRNSYHYYITESGRIYNFIDPKYEANHAGESVFRGYDHMNHYSIGICLENNGHTKYTEEQYKKLGWLIQTIYARFPSARRYQVVGHSDVAFPSGRKQDPGPMFNWSTLTGYIQYYDRPEFVGHIYTTR